MSVSATVLGSLDLRLQQAVQDFRAAGNTEFQVDPLRSLYISEAEVDDLIERPSIRQERSNAVLDHLANVRRQLALDNLELDLLLICLAPELSNRYERLYAYLQDDATRRRPSLELAERLLERDLLPAVRRLLRLGVLSRLDDASAQGGLWSAILRVDEHVVEHLCGGDGLDPRIHATALLLAPFAELTEVEVHAAAVAQLRRLLSVPDGHAVCLRGPVAVGGLLAVRSATGGPVLVVDATGMDEEAVRAACRDACLHDAVLAWRGDPPSGRVLGDYACRSVVLGNPPRDGEMIAIDLPALDAATRARLWQLHLDERCPPEAARELGARYQLVEFETMREVVGRAFARAALNDSAAVSMADLIDAARAAAGPPMDGLAAHVVPRYGWDDLVLPPDALARLRELCARRRFRSTVFDDWQLEPRGGAREGITALFVGQPGTGKSMAAQVIAADLGYDLYRVDLSSVVSKYIGETEKNLEAIFAAAERGEAVLLFDEADALFGKRSEVRDAHDRYANIEVAYLLQRLERYSGVVILTSNLNGNLDDAFLRRLDCVVEFPLPQEAERRELWRRALPSTAPLDADVDLQALARTYKLAGGHIRNTCVTAAFLAASDASPIRLQHVLWAIRREYQKLGKLAADSEFEPSRLRS